VQHSLKHCGRSKYPSCICTHTRPPLQTLSKRDADVCQPTAGHGAGAPAWAGNDAVDPSHFTGPTQMVNPDVFFGRPPTASSGVQGDDRYVHRRHDGYPLAPPATASFNLIHGHGATPQVPVPTDRVNVSQPPWRHAAPHACNSVLESMPDMGTGRLWHGNHAPHALTSAQGQVDDVHMSHLYGHGGWHINGAGYRPAYDQDHVGPALNGRMPNDSWRSTSELCGVSGSTSMHPRSGAGSADQPIMPNGDGPDVCAMGAL